MPLPIITKINDRVHFAEMLKTNPGVIIIKFGAEWCGPCKAIESDVKQYFNQMPDNIQCAIIDVDECFDVYAFLKNKKMINGIPAILCYYKDNVNYIPNDMVTGSNMQQIRILLTKCAQHAASISSVNTDSIRY